MLKILSLIKQGLQAIGIVAVLVVLVMISVVAMYLGYLLAIGIVLLSLVGISFFLIRLGSSKKPPG